MFHRVVISGLGVVSSLGHAKGANSVPGKKPYVENLFGGKSGLGPPTGLGEGTPLINALGLVGDCSASDLRKVVREPKQLKSLGRPGELGLQAAYYALCDGGLYGDGTLDPYQVSVSWASDQWSLPCDDWVKVGSTSFAGKENIPFWELVDGCLTSLNPLWQIQVMTNGPAAAVAQQFGFMGPNNTSSSACTGGLNALREGFMNLQTGDVEYALVGGSDSKISPWNIAGFFGLTALSKRRCAPEEASAPCSRHRDGFVLSEGGAAFVLERYDHAVARGAPIYAEITAFGTVCGATHPTDTNPQAVARCVQNVCRQARINFSDFDLLCAHATSTPMGDVKEVEGIHRAFGGDFSKPVVYNPKCAVGHQIIPAGLFGLAPAVLALHKGVIPPNLNLKDRDPSCDLNYSGETAHEQPVHRALVSALGFGGGIVMTSLQKV